jgi:hypothetical protein
MYDEAGLRGRVAEVWEPPNCKFQQRSDFVTELVTHPTSNRNSSRLQVLELLVLKSGNAKFLLLSHHA